MRDLLLTAIAILFWNTSVASPVVSLACEHDGGVNVKTGLRDGTIGLIFGFSIDLPSKEITAGFSGAKSKTVLVDRYSITLSIEYGEPGDSEFYSYLVSRVTGTLYARRIVSYQGESHTWDARGQCVTSERKF